MSEFLLSVAARSAILAIVRASGCADPVATIRDVSEISVSQETARQLLSPTLSDEAKEALLDKHSTGWLSAEGRALEVCVFERNEYDPEDVFDAGGLSFGLAASIRALLRRCVLDVQAQRFVLVRDGRSFSSMAALLSAD